MLSIEECRRILGGGFEGSDGELENLRRSLYGIANGLVDAYRRNGVPPAPVEVSEIGDAIVDLPVDIQEVVLERAAIMEFEGGVSRDKAERYSLARVLGSADRKGAGE